MTCSMDQRRNCSDAKVFGLLFFVVPLEPGSKTNRLSRYESRKQHLTHVFSACCNPAQCKKAINPAASYLLLDYADLWRFYVQREEPCYVHGSAMSIGKSIDRQDEGDF